MSNDYGGTFITLTDENGEEIVLEYLDTVEYEGKIYMAFFPTIDEETDLLQFYTTMVMELDVDHGQLAQTLVQWNFLCPLGAFGIFEEGNQLYHKYGIVLNGTEELDELAEQGDPDSERAL